MATETGPLVASGRDGDVFEFGPGLLLRRTKDGRVIEREAETMNYAREHGYPVPAIHEVLSGGTEIVMERIEGPMMMDVMLHKPWLMGHFARQLADLHDRLHVIPAPDFLPQLDDGDRLVHLDLHPMNVIISPTGPVVIDWTNAARADGLTDVAVTRVLMTCPEFPGSQFLNTIAKPVRAYMARTYSARYRGRALDEHVVEAANLKQLDTNLSPKEVAACQRLAARAASRWAPG